MIKKEVFSPDLQKLSAMAKALSHPARLAILEYLSETKTCISGDISDYIPLSRSTVSQHLSELKKAGLIHGEIEGIKINYCLCKKSINEYSEFFSAFFGKIDKSEVNC